MCEVQKPLRKTVQISTTPRSSKILSTVTARNITHSRSTAHILIKALPPELIQHSNIMQARISRICISA
jgi:hypothetical protein